MAANSLPSMQDTNSIQLWIKKSKCINLISHQSGIDKIFFVCRGSMQMEVSLLMKEREDVGLKYLENPKGKYNLFFLITHYSLLLSRY